MPDGNGTMNVDRPPRSQGDRALHRPARQAPLRRCQGTARDQEQVRRLLRRVRPRVGARIGRERVGRRMPRLPAQTVGDCLRAGSRRHPRAPSARRQPRLRKAVWRLTGDLITNDAITAGCRNLHCRHQMASVCRQFRRLISVRQRHASRPHAVSRRQLIRSTDQVGY